MKELTINNPSTEWSVYHSKGEFAIGVRCWKFGAESDEWKWNVYAFIYEGHPLFLKPSEAKLLPFHGGCTFDKYVTYEESEGNVYHWMKTHKTLKVGCDYAHYGDEYFDGCNPADGIPGTILYDCQELIAALGSML